MLKRTEKFKQQFYWKPLFRTFLVALCAISLLIVPILLTGCGTGSSSDGSGASG